MTRDAEEWRPVPGYEEAYEVSDLGRIRSLARIVVCKDGRRMRQAGRLRKPVFNKRVGRYEVVLSRAGQTCTYRVHRLVLSAFVGPANGLDGCHNNGDPTDNRLVNLRWDSKSGNMLDRRSHGTDHQLNKTCCPRGHALVAPNLILSTARLGYRGCRACNRAHSDVRYAKKTGRPHNFVAWSHDHHARILAGK